MGSYCVMGRCFNKIRLSNYIHKKIRLATARCGAADGWLQRVQLGGTHIRIYATTRWVGDGWVGEWVMSDAEE